MSERAQEHGITKIKKKIGGRAQDYRGSNIISLWANRKWTLSKNLPACKLKVTKQALDSVTVVFLINIVNKAYRGKSKHFKSQALR